MAEQLVTCPKCGHSFDVNAERIAALSRSTRAVWEAGGRAWQSGKAQIGPEWLATELGKSKGTIAYHLDILVRNGLVVRIPQNKYKRVRHLYMGALPNGATSN